MKNIFLILMASSLFAQSLYFNAFRDINKAKRLLHTNPSKANALFIEAKGYLKETLKTSIEKNQPSSQVLLLLGKLYLNGWGVKNDSKKAALFLCSAKKLGNIPAKKLISKNNLSCPTKINIKELAK